MRTSVNIERIQLHRLMEGFTIVEDKKGTILGFYGHCSLDGRYYWYGVGSTVGDLCDSATEAENYILHPELRPDENRPIPETYKEWGEWPHQVD